MTQALALIFLLTLSPLFVILSLLILIFDGFPVFFLQERIGLNKVPFKVIKFRTMKNEKVTFTGKLFRKTGFDELPQLINILKGDMNFIGPRPLTQNDITRLGWEDNYYKKRWLVKPGISGLAQLSPRCHKKMSFFLDGYYAENKSFLMDIKIILVSSLSLILGKEKAKKIYFKR